MNVFAPSDFLDLAGKLCVSTSDESELRTSISRSYYASFLSARERLAACGHYLPKKSGADHQGVLNTLVKLGSWRIRNKLDSLRQLRSLADYELTAPVGFKQAERAKLLAQALIRRIPQID